VPASSYFRVLSYYARVKSDRLGRVQCLRGKLHPRGESFWIHLLNDMVWDVWRKHSVIINNVTSLGPIPSACPCVITKPTSLPTQFSRFGSARSIVTASSVVVVARQIHFVEDFFVPTDLDWYPYSPPLTRVINHLL